MQFESDSVSREISKFTTDDGLLRFKRINLEINMASETLQRKMDEILGNIPNCMAIADDV